ncbi:CHAT domain-containing protein [Desulfococcaceae bacterium HSG8]|nr:CHAT domain-containing protein [Desulfococcaceae bacterium HSG8]
MLKEIMTIVLTIGVFLICGHSETPAATEEPGKAKQLIAEGEKFCHKGNFELAARSWEQAITLLNPKEDAYLPAVIRLSNAYQSLGHYQRAMTAFQKALPVAGKSNDSYHKALFFSSLGDLYVSLENTKDALRYLEKGESIAIQAKNPHVLANLLNNRGNALTQNEDYQGAAEAYNECLDLIEQSPGTIHEPHLHELKSKVVINLTRVMFQTDDQEAAAALDSALRHIEKLSDSHNKAAALISLSLLIRDTMPATDRSELAPYSLRMLNEAKRIGKDLRDDRIASYAYGYAGQLYEAETRYSEALRLTRSAIFFAQKGHFPEILYLWQWQSGRLFKAGGDIEKAVSAYHSAISTLNPIRGELLREHRSEKNAFYEKVKPVYLGFAELLLKQTETIPDDKSREDKLKKARDIMELLKTAELQDFFQDECVTSVRTKITSPDHAPSHTAILYPILLPDSPVLLLTLPDGMRQVRIPADSERLIKTAKQFQKQLQMTGSDEYQENAKQLYNWLIRPVGNELTTLKIDTLIIAPDGALRLIPFSALHDGNHFLVEKYAVVTVPGITLTDLKPPEGKLVEILANGLSEARHGFSPLPNVPGELENIRTVMGGRILQDKEYTIDNLTREFKNHEYPIVHMATHGVFGGTVKDTFLLTYDDRLTMDRLEQLIDLARFREQQVELLTLSACQTAMGDERAALGLAGVAIKAGVRSVIATLWSVHDESTYVAISEFYRQLKTPGISKAEALQNAQKKLIAHQRYQHPAYWAPFLLIGNWM